MAMEQGEKRTIHPFFCKDFGVQAKAAPQSTSVADSVPSHDTSNGAVHHDTVNEDCEQPAGNSESSNIPTSPDITLEDDTNSDRRKRRRTDQHVVSSIANGTPLNPEEGNTTASNPVTIHDDATLVSTIKSQIPTTDNTDSPKPQPPTIENPTPTGPANDATVQTEERRYPERQRTLRLNPNGKLLSSPTGKQPEEKEPKKKDKGKKGSRKPKKDGNKLVIIKYASHENAREKIGKIIDDIINARTRYQSQRVASKPASVPTPKQTPRATVNQPPKPTHPFFSKNSTRKPDTPTQSHSENSTTLNPLAETPRRPLSLTREGSGVISAPSFRPRVSKFPEPIHPLWPPRDFVHVRGAGAGTNPYRDSLYSNADQRKAKGISVRIHDKENILLSGPFGQSVKKPMLRALRLPTRFVASGNVLRKALTSQLSEHSSRHKNGDTPIKKDAHPGISRLYSSLATFLTAFDRGQCDTCLWTQKYAPNSAEEVLQTGKEAHMLRDWLKFLIISAVDTGKPSKDTEKAKQKSEERRRAKKRQKKDKLDGFIVSSEDEASEMGELESEEDELAGDVTVFSSKRTVIRSGDLMAGSKGSERGRMTNAILLSGPAGSGKTASVHAVAKELGFEVFEINPGSRRNGRDVVERVGDMTRNHIVHKMHFADEGSSQLPEASTQGEEQEGGKQNKLLSFFKSRPADTKTKKETPSTPKEAEPEADAKRSQKQSLILLEEADILFEEDRQFWSGVMSLIQQSRRPIIITCNNEKLIPSEDISFHAILRYRPPPQDLAVDYLLLMAANEGHMLQRNSVSDLYRAAGSDLRKSIMDLNFWCQMAIGSKKSGLDWMMDRWPPGRDCDENGDTLRVLSLNTYQQYMGWFGRDMLLDGTMDSEVESQRESLDWWERSIQDSENMAFSSSHTLSPAKSKHEQLEQLQYESEYADMRSALDLLCTGCSVDTRLDAVDPSVPPIPERHKANYIEGHQLLHADLKPEYSSLALAMGSTMEILIGKTFRPHNVDVESSQAAQVLANTNDIHAAHASAAQLTTAFEPMMRGDDQSSPSARLAPSFHSGPGALWEDLAPYVRAIVAFDLRLEQYRFKLSGFLSPSSGSKRKMRKTRASRAALEGGDKAHTRRERWFPPDTNPARILATGSKEWQDLLVHSGHFIVRAMPEPGKESSREASREPSREGSEPASESSGEGGI